MTHYPTYLIFTPAYGDQTPTHLYCKHAYGEQSYQHFPTTAVDAKGRKIGFRAEKRTVSITAPAEGERVHSLTSIDKGYREAFEVRIQMTKHGVAFGASQGAEEFATEAEADEYITKTIAARRAKYEKK
jgi:hypothetical protein